MIPDYLVAQFFHITKAELEVLSRRPDFPRAVLRLPQYTYYDPEKVKQWVTRLQLKPSDIPKMILEQNEILGDDTIGNPNEWFSIEAELEDENDLALEWLSEQQSKGTAA